MLAKKPAPARWTRWVIADSAAPVDLPWMRKPRMILPQALGAR
jgi:hypothetical protein